MISVTSVFRISVVVRNPSDLRAYAQKPIEGESISNTAGVGVLFALPVGRSESDASATAGFTSSGAMPLLRSAGIGAHRADHQRWLGPLPVVVQCLSSHMAGRSRRRQNVRQPSRRAHRAPAQNAYGPTEALMSSTIYCPGPWWHDLSRRR